MLECTFFMYYMATMMESSDMDKKEREKLRLDKLNLSTEPSTSIRK